MSDIFAAEKCEDSRGFGRQFGWVRSDGLCHGAGSVPVSIPWNGSGESVVLSWLMWSASCFGFAKAQATIESTIRVQVIRLDFAMIYYRSPSSDIAYEDGTVPAGNGEVLIDCIGTHDIPMTELVGVLRAFWQSNHSQYLL